MTGKTATVSIPPYQHNQNKTIMLNIEDPRTVKPFGLLNLGFRPFFLAAGLFAVISMLLWFALYILHQPLLPTALPAMLWHGHEMVFGYSLAVIAGFLLTAIKNWTGQQTLHGRGLLLLALLWLAARILPFLPFATALYWMAVADQLFMIVLISAMLQPIVKVRQWKHLAIILKIALLFLSNGLFYLGIFNVLPTETIQWGLLSGVYLVISLIMLMGRRVIPFFIEKGVDEDAVMKNWKWLDISSIFLFLVFTVLIVFFHYPLVNSILAGILFVLHAIRLWGWHTRGIWRKPLLWVLYLGYGFIVLGFALQALTHWLGLSPWLALHAFAAGGIGIITMGMMCRVALGHTGRNVFAPPKVVGVIFALLVLAAIVRVILPILLPDLYLWWIGITQLLWVIGFLLFVVVYAPMLIKARVDGRPG